jgi:hypothetical protein
MFLNFPLPLFRQFNYNTKFFVPRSSTELWWRVNQGEFVEIMKLYWSFVFRCFFRFLPYLVLIYMDLYSFVFDVGPKQYSDSSSFRLLSFPPIINQPSGNFSFHLRMHDLNVVHNVSYVGELVFRLDDITLQTSSKIRHKIDFRAESMP